MTTNQIANCLYEHYRQKYPNIPIKIEPEATFITDRLTALPAIVFRHHLQILLLNTMIIIEKYHHTWDPIAPTLESWEDYGQVHYEDPLMEAKLDELIDKIIMTQLP